MWVSETDAERVTLQGELAAGVGRVYRAVLIRPGEWLGKGIRCAPEVLQAAAAKFDGLASFLNPPGPLPGQHGYPGLERLLGVTEHARWDEAEGAIVADYRLADTDVARWFRRLVDGWLVERAAGRPVPEIGLSAVPWVRLGPTGADGLRDVTEIVRVDQVDAVYRPAAGGEFVQVLNASGVEGWAGFADPRLQVEGLAAEAGAPDTSRLQVEGLNEGDSMGEKAKTEIGLGTTAALPGATIGAGAPAVAAVTVAGSGPGDAAAGTAGQPAAQAAAGGGVDAAALQPTAAALHPMVAALRETLLDGRLALSGLPERWRRVVMAGLPQTWSVEELDAAIARIKAAWAEEEAARTVQGVRPTVSGMLDSQDQITEALSALLESRVPRAGVRPLSGIREAYLALSGDYEMTGLFHAERVTLANVSSTTMANIVANVLNKVVVNEFQQYPRWWQPIVLTDNFSTLQTIKWITLGGVGELPVVSEGAAYTELTWDDAAETASWQKRGGYLGITLEAMDKDDVGRLRNAPRALAQAAWLTLGKTISAIFTTAAGVGPTLADGKALFHTDHGNLTQLPLSSAAWNTAKLAMRKQTEVNSGERLGGLTSPRHLLVPPDLENTALTILASEGMPGTADNDVNPEAAGNTHDARLVAARRRITVVDLWTDTNNWAAVADPRMYPTIGLGFRYGETPEIFSVASPTSGLMFTNDVLPVKVRWFFAAGPMDYRGLYKANVS